MCLSGVAFLRCVVFVVCSLLCVCVSELLWIRVVFSGVVVDGVVLCVLCYVSLCVVFVYVLCGWPLFCVC